MVNTISIKELRPKLSNILNHIHNKFDRYVITRHGKPEIVMLSVEDFESIIETLAIQSDKDLMKRIKKGEKDLKSGKGASLDKLNRELGLV